MRRPLVILALVATAGIHAALAPEHLAQMPRVGISFVAAAAAALAVAGWVGLGHRSSYAFVAAAVIFAGLIAGWALAVTSGIPLLIDGPEPIALAAVVCKLLEAAGLLAAASPAWRRVLVFAVPAALLLAAVPGRIVAADNLPRVVEIPGKLFEPERLDVLVGETVTWRNLDAASHTVTADNGSFDSGDVAPDGVFSLTFDRPGRTTYHCAIHRFMTGEIDVFALALTGPRDPVAIGARFSLRGLAPRGNDVVRVERRSADEQFIQETTATVSADGSFRVSVPAVTSTDYRAVVGTLASPVVHVDVSPRITLRVRRVGRRTLIEGDASPPQPRMRAVLQVYSRERFDWLPFARVRFDTGSRLRTTLSTRRQIDLRLVLLHATRGLVGGTSNAVSVMPRPPAAAPPKHP